MTTALAPTNHNNTNTAVAMPLDFVPVSGLDQIEPEEFGVLRLKLVQPQSDIVDGIKHTGEYYCKEINEFFPSPRVLVLAIAKSRVLFQGKFSRDSEPLCRSLDGATPMQTFIGQRVTVNDNNGNIAGEAIIPATCQACPFSQWGPNREKPLCRLNDNWAALLETGDPVVMSLAGSSAAASKQLKTLVRANAFKGRNTFIELGSTLRSDDKGRYYVPTITVIKDAPPEDLVSLAQSVSGASIAARAAESVERAESVEAQPTSDDIPF